MRYDLEDTTFIIPIRIESDDRMRNIITSLCFLLDNFDTNIIVKESDSESVFTQEVLPQVKEYTDTQNIKYIFEKSDSIDFHRTRFLNEMLKQSTTKVVVNYDCDILLPIKTYLDAQQMILEGDSDVVYPYGFGEYMKKVNANDEIVSEFLSNDCNFSILDSVSNMNDARYGFCQFFDRDIYLKCGGENEKFIAYAPEDEERYYRFNTLGYKIDRIDNFVYHLEHKRTQNSWYTNPHMNKNFLLWEEIKKMNKQELEVYYNIV